MRQHAVQTSPPNRAGRRQTVFFDKQHTAQPTKSTHPPRQCNLTLAPAGIWSKAPTVLYTAVLAGAFVSQCLFLMAISISISVNYAITAL